MYTNLIKEKKLNRKEYQPWYQSQWTHDKKTWPIIHYEHRCKQYLTCRLKGYVPWSSRIYFTSPRRFKMRKNNQCNIAVWLKEGTQSSQVMQGKDLTNIQHSFTPRSLSKGWRNTSLDILLGSMFTKAPNVFKFGLWGLKSCKRAVATDTTRCLSSWLAAWQNGSEEETYSGSWFQRDFCWAWQQRCPVTAAHGSRSSLVFIQETELGWNLPRLFPGDLLLLARPCLLKAPHQSIQNMGLWGTFQFKQEQWQTWHRTS